MEEPFNARFQLSHAERFCEVVVRVEVHAFHLGALVGHGAHHDDRGLRGLSESPADFVTIDARHRDVQDRQIRTELIEGVQRLGALTDLHHLIPGALQLLAHELPKRSLIVDDENAWLIHRSPPR